MFKLKKIKELLSSETDFSQYLDLLSQYARDYLILIAAGDTPCGSSKFTPELAVKLMSVGFAIPLHNKWRCSYAAVADSGKLVFEGISQTHTVCFKQELGGTSVMVESSGYDVGDGVRGSKILINGGNYTVGWRGLTFVIFDKTTETLIDSVRFDTYNTDIPCYRCGESIVSRKFRESYPEITFIMPQYPPFPEQNLSQNEAFIIKNKIRHNMIKVNAETLQTAINEYIDTPDGIREVLSTPVTYIGTDGARHFYDRCGQYLNVVNGHRLTTNQPDDPKRVIYTVGGCSTLGIGVRDCGTLASQLQSILNDRVPELGFIVENYGFYLDETDSEKEIIAILEALPLKPGDVVVGLNGIITDSPEWERPHDFGELFFDDMHVTERAQELVALEVFKTLQKHDYFKDTLKKDKRVLLKTSGDLDYGLKPEQRDMLELYKSALTEFYERQLAGFARRIGAIVMNCNPFTLGHRYLVEQCAKKVDFLVVFVVQEDKSLFPFEARIDLVDKGTSDLPNVGVIESGCFILSTLTFTEYFNKSELQDTIVDSSVDVTLFAREIAPAMHISVRFAGSEPFDRVTKQYNETLAGILPRYGIEFEEIQRLEIDGEAVSASRVRDLLEKRDWGAIERLVPPATFAYLKENFI